MTQGSAVFDTLLDTVLTLQPLGADRFLGDHAGHDFGRVYGGQLAAQGLRAAAATTGPDRAVHSVHVNFLRTGDPLEPVEYTVARLRDSPSFSTRSVTAAQGARQLAVLTASFQVDRAGFEHAVPPTGDAPLDPQSLARREARIAAAFADVPPVARVPWPIDLRYVDRAPWDAPPEDPDTAPDRLWLRADGWLGDGSTPDGATLHACVFAYASDLTMFEPVIARHAGPPHDVTWERVSRGQVRGATLDHSIWFHRPFRVDEWLLHERESTVAHGARGLATGRYFTGDGMLVASVAQEVALLVDPLRQGVRT